MRVFTQVSHHTSIPYNLYFSSIHHHFLPNLFYYSLIFLSISFLILSNLILFFFSYLFSDLLSFIQHLSQFSHANHSYYLKYNNTIIEKFGQVIRLNYENKILIELNRGIVDVIYSTFTIPLLVTKTNVEATQSSSTVDSLERFIDPTFGE